MSIPTKAGRLDAVVRFELWGNGPGVVDSAITTLQEKLLSSRDALRSEGFLLISSRDTPVSEPVPSVNGWRKATTLQVLYEYQYLDTEQALGLIAEIDITMVGEVKGSMVLTDQMAAWNYTGAPPLAVTGPQPDIPGAQWIAALSILAFLPTGWDGRGVTVSTSSIGGNRSHSYASVREFFNSFPAPASLDTHSFSLGSSRYEARTMTFPGPPTSPFPDPVPLSGPRDGMTVTYADTHLGGSAVVYLRALIEGATP